MRIFVYISTLLLLPALLFAQTSPLLGPFQIGGYSGATNDAVLSYDVIAGAGYWRPSAGLFSKWTESGGNIYRPTGNVGIGTPTPSSTLEVLGEVKSARFVTDAAGSHSLVESRRNGGRDMQIDNVDGDMWFFSQAAGYHTRNISSTGFWGFGLLNPTSRLHVSGAVRSDALYANFNVGVGTTTPTEALEVVGYTKANRFVANNATSATLLESRTNDVRDWQIDNVNRDYWYYNGNAYSFFIRRNTGFVGIGAGNSLPARELDVSGIIRASNLSAAAPSQFLFSNSSGDILRSDIDVQRVLARVSALKNKNVVLFGDSFSASLTDQARYPVHFQEYTGANLTSYAVAGNTTLQQLTALQTLLAGNPNALSAQDYTIIFMGVNDFAASVRPLGTVDDAPAAATISGSIKKIIELIYTAKPAIEVFLVCPPEGFGNGAPYKTTNTQGWSMSDLAELITEIGNFYSTRVLNFYSNSNWNNITKDYYTGDLLHPSVEGAKKLALFLAKSIENDIGGSVPTKKTVQSFGTGNIPFGTGIGLTESSNLYFSNSNQRLGVGTNAPARALTVRAAEPYIRFEGIADNPQGFEFYGSGGGTKEGEMLFNPANGNFNFSAGRSAGWGGNISFATDLTERLRIGSNGLVQVHGLANGDDKMLFANVNGILSLSSLSASQVLTTSTITAGDVTGLFNTLQIAAGAVGTSELAINAVGTSNMIDGAITNAKITDIAPAKITGAGAAGRVLRSNGTNYVDSPVTHVQGVEYSTTSPNIGQFYIASASGGPMVAVNQNGDVDGNPTTNRVKGLQNRPVANISPTAGQILGWNGSAWLPTPPSNIYSSDGTINSNRNVNMANNTVLKFGNTSTPTSFAHPYIEIQGYGADGYSPKYLRFLNQNATEVGAIQAGDGSVLTLTGGAVAIQSTSSSVNFQAGSNSFQMMQSGGFRLPALSVDPGTTTGLIYYSTTNGGRHKVYGPSGAETIATVEQEVTGTLGTNTASFTLPRRQFTSFVSITSDATVTVGDMVEGKEYWIVRADNNAGATLTLTRDNVQVTAIRVSGANNVIASTTTVPVLKTAILRRMQNVVYVVIY